MNDTCYEGYEYYWNQYHSGQITEEEWDEWFKTHCLICTYFSGSHCAYGEMTCGSIQVDKGTDR